MSAICGIVGESAAGGRGRRDVSLMLDLLAPRGPDGSLVHEEPGTSRPVVFGARRIAVPGTSAQPVIGRGAKPGTVAVCDGTIFNREQVRGFVRAAGRTLRSDDDAELFAHLYELEGPAGLRRVDAQFTLALWDATRNALVLARDPLGVRAVYYRATAGGVLFASEIKALLAVPDVPVEADDIAASHYLTFLTVPGPRTLFKGISKLAAGSTVTFDAAGNADVKPYWDLLWDPVAEVDDESFYVDRVRKLHDAAVERRMVSSGPIAALVSGGNDSSANASIIARKIKEGGGNPAHLLHTFTVGLKQFEGEAKYNDLMYAKQVADLIGSTHHESLMTNDEFLETIGVTIDAMDDLVSEPSSIFLYHALKLAKQQGMKVVVTGEANDELSCGHGEMISIRDGYYRRWLPFSRLPGVLKKVAAAVAPLVSPKRSDILRRAAAGEEYFWNYEIAWPESEMGNILSPEGIRATASERAGAVVLRDVARIRASAHGDRDYLNHMIYRMMQDYYFGNLMLGKLDLLAGQLGLDARCPYTEQDYAHFVYNIPAKFKQKDGVVKYFFKKAIAGILPDSIIHRPKQGFRTPVSELFKGPLADWGQSTILDGGFTAKGFLRRDELARLMAAHRTGVPDWSNRLWTVLVLNLWHKRWIESSRPRPATRSDVVTASA
jgi:asparagine synthase (glutamine-hydrolysing)